jgi:Co/Zn/Cd efflux system component
MDAHHDHDHAIAFEGLSHDYRRRLAAVILINAAMFVVEMTAGSLAGSQALKADALDFFADTVTYGASLAVIGAAVTTRSLVAMAKGASLLLMGLWILAATAYRVFVVGVPQADVMGLVAFLALAANVGSVLLLVRFREGDANIRSVWLCSRNDAIGNVAVMVAALGVWATAAGWPDLIVAGGMATLFVNSSVKILRQGWREYRQGDGRDAVRL